MQQQGILGLGMHARSLMVKQRKDDAGERHARPGNGNSGSIPFRKRIRKLDELMMLLSMRTRSFQKQAKQAITGLHDHCNDLSEGIETFLKPR